jgi:fatty acid desaturase
MSITYSASEATVHREGTLARRGRLVTGGLFLSTGLMLFGVGFWLWSLPALAVLVPLARADRPALSPRRWRR